MRESRGRVMSLVPQGASGALNPALRIGTQLREAWNAHSSVSWDAAWPDVEQLLVACGLPGDDTLLRRFPSEISIGQAQRVLIVMALMHRPSLVIADEPTSALDVITQSDVLDLLASFTVQRRTSVLLISHDLSVVAAACDRIAILHEGQVVECGAAERVLTAPEHAYTRELVGALGRLQGRRVRRDA
jgi:ABC-type dipeptide/oligopeptide/nickel transport system ATPase component